jgi:hypothetical protein
LAAPATRCGGSRSSYGGLAASSGLVAVTLSGMQIMEVDDRAVRAAVWTFQHPINCPRFVLFPMAHIAEPAFYKNVTARVGRSDLSVVEGIVGKSRHAKTIVSIYDVIARIDHLGLVVENIDYRAMSIPLVRPDMTGEAFDRGWQRAPIRHRLLLRASRLAFAFGSVRRHATRRVVADVLDAQAGSMNVSIENEKYHRVASRLWDTLIDDNDRDRLLVQALTSIHEERSQESIVVAVVYGAAHMPAVVRHLQTLGYQSTECEWLTVFGFDSQ